MKGRVRRGGGGGEIYFCNSLKRLTKEGVRRGEGGRGRGRGKGGEEG